MYTIGKLLMSEDPRLGIDMTDRAENFIALGRFFKQLTNSAKIQTTFIALNSKSLSSTKESKTEHVEKEPRNLVFWAQKVQPELKFFASIIG